MVLAFLAIDFRGAFGQGFDGSQPGLTSSKLNVYCDPNGDNTGTCWTFENNSPLDCQYASQDFIQCSLRETKKKLICLAYAPFQFACRQEVDSGMSSLGKQTLRSNLGESSPQNSVSQPQAFPTLFNSDFTDVFSSQ